MVRIVTEWAAIARICVPVLFPHFWALTYAESP